MRPSSRDQSALTSQTGCHVRTLDALLEHGGLEDSVSRSDLDLGDWVKVTTRNSVYSLRCLGENLYSVSGGWFDHCGMSPSTVTVNGCTWGGSAIKHDIVAAPGLFLEFANGVKTTRIRSVEVVRCEIPSDRM